MIASVMVRVRVMHSSVVAGLCLLAACVDDVSGGSEGTTGPSETTSDATSTTNQSESSRAPDSTSGDSSTSAASTGAASTGRSSSGDTTTGSVGCEGDLDCEGTVEGPCEVAVCDLTAGLCVAEADDRRDGQSCDDGNPCSAMAVCDSGECLQTSVVDCGEIDTECATGVCDPTAGGCVPEPVRVGTVCVMGVAQCNVGACDEAGECALTPVADGTPCDDANLCTSADQCVAGSCGGATQPGCTSYFSENFETCSLAGWTLNPQWECGVPELVGPVAAVQGTDLLGTDLDDAYDDGLAFATSFAQLPEVSLVGAVHPTLLYQAYVDTEGGTADGYNVQISTDGGASFSVVTSVQPTYPLLVGGEPAYGGSSVEWAPVSVDLTAFAGQSVALRFAFQSDGMLNEAGVYVDGVQIVEADHIPVAITTASLPNAVEQNSYSFALSSGGGTGDGVWTIVDQTNAAWLAVTGSGDLFGFPGPGSVGPASVTLRIEEPTNPSNFAEMEFAFAVAGLVYLDDIEAACPGGFTLAGDWQCGAPTSGPFFAFSGTQVLATNLGGDHSSNLSWASNTASSGPISLLGMTSPQLSFRVWYETEGQTYDGFNLKVSTNGGASYELVTEVTPAYPLTIDGQAAWGGGASALGWQEYAADLSAYAGMSVSLQFAMRSDGSVNNPGVYLDDLAISD